MITLLLCCCYYGRPPRAEEEEPDWAKPLPPDRFAKGQPLRFDRSTLYTDLEEGEAKKREEEARRKARASRPIKGGFKLPMADRASYTSAGVKRGLRRLLENPLPPVREQVPTPGYMYSSIYIYIYTTSIRTSSGVLSASLPLLAQEDP